MKVLWLVYQSGIHTENRASVELASIVIVVQKSSGKTSSYYFIALWLVFWAVAFPLLGFRVFVRGKWWPHAQTPIWRDGMAWVTLPAARLPLA